MPVADATHFVVITNSQNTPARCIDCQRLRSRLCGVHRIDIAIEKENDAHIDQYLVIIYTLMMISIPPMIVVGESCSFSSKIARSVPSKGCTNSVEAAADPSICSRPLNQAR